MPTAELEGTTCSDAQNEKHSRRRDCLNCEGLHAVIATQRLLPRPRTLETLGCLGLIYFSTPFIYVGILISECPEKYLSPMAQIWNVVLFRGVRWTSRNSLTHFSH